MPSANASGPTRRLNAISLKLVKLIMLAETKFRGTVSRQPIKPPSSDSKTDSRKKLVRMLPRENPSTRSVPTSLALRATAAYMVFMAAKLDPTAMIMAMNTPKYCTGAAELVCESIYSTSVRAFELRR